MRKLEYLDFDLQITPAERGFVARVLDSPAGEASTPFDLPFEPIVLENLVLKLRTPRSGTRRAFTPEMTAAREFGGKLFEAVFQGDVGVTFRRSCDKVLAQNNRGLRIKLRLQDAPVVADLPWEFLFDKTTDSFLAHSVETPIVRYVELTESQVPLAVEPPLRILGVISSPLGLPQLNITEEKNKIAHALSPFVSAHRLDLRWLDSPTLLDLNRELERQNVHVLHFIGHGGFDNAFREGVLALEDTQHQVSWMGAHRLGTAWHDCRTLRLVVLNSCEGARNTVVDPFASVATTLIRKGVPAVVAMQFEISDSAAVHFAGAFYEQLAAGMPIDACVAAARKSVYFLPNEVEWGTPVLYMRSRNGVLFVVSEMDPSRLRELGLMLKKDLRNAQSQERYVKIMHEAHDAGLSTSAVITVTWQALVSNTNKELVRAVINEFYQELARRASGST